MATPKKHIEPTADLIRKYLAGELDDKTMHALERQALDDPFLAEALEGYGKSPQRREPVLDDLRARLQQRVATPASGGVVRRLDRRWLAAASILLLLAISAVLLLQREPAVKEVAQELPAAKVKDTLTPQTPAAAMQQPDTAVPAAAVEAGNTAADKAPVAPKKKPAPRPAVKEAELAKASARNEELSDRAARSVASAPAVVAAAPPPPPAAALEREQKDNAFFQTQDAAKNDTIYIGRKTSPLARQNAQPDMGQKLEGKVAGVESKYSSYHESGDLRLISGKVLDATTGELMRGAIVHERSTNKRVITDSTGTFALTVNAGARTSLDVSFIGYKNTVVPVPMDKSNLNIYLPVNSNGLSEVVLTGVKGRVQPQPAIGLNAYLQFMNALPPVPVAGLPDTLFGMVRVTFTVHADSSLHQIKAIQPFHPAAGAAAEKRVDEGPKWAPVKGRKSKVETMIPVKLYPLP